MKPLTSNLNFIASSWVSKLPLLYFPAPKKHFQQRKRSGDGSKIKPYEWYFFLSICLILISIYILIGVPNLDQHNNLSLASLESRIQLLWPQHLQRTLCVARFASTCKNLEEMEKGVKCDTKGRTWYKNSRSNWNWLVIMDHYGGLLYYLGYWGYYNPWAHGRKTYQPTRISWNGTGVFFMAHIQANIWMTQIFPGFPNILRRWFCFEGVQTNTYT